MQKRFFLAPAAIVAFILFFTVFGDRGLLMINRLHRDRDEMQQKLSELKGENEKLKREIAALQTDRRYLESIARRDFGLVRSNETIYQFPGSEKADQKPQQANPTAQPAAQPDQQGAQGGQQVAEKVEPKPAPKVAPKVTQKSAQAQSKGEQKKAPKAERKGAAKSEPKDAGKRNDQKGDAAAKR